jgi:hypothetical protein
MSGRRYIQIGDRRYLWREILKMRREQRKSAKREQPTLFPLQDDSRPATQKTASGRYEEPMLFDH